MHLAIIAAPLPGHLNPLQVLVQKPIGRGWRVSVVRLECAKRLVTDPALRSAALPAEDAAAFEELIAPNGPFG